MNSIVGARQSAVNNTTSNGFTLNAAAEVTKLEVGTMQMLCEVPAMTNDWFCRGRAAGVTAKYYVDDNKYQYEFQCV